MSADDLAAYRLQLSAEREALIKYLQMKCLAEDWHGAADACMDLRDVDSEMKILDLVSK